MTAARELAERAALANEGLVAIGVFGSYARGEDGVGSDLDLVVVTHDEGAALPWRDLLDLPVQAEILSYTQHEWDALMRSGSRMAMTLRHETLWLHGAASTPTS